MRNLNAPKKSACTDWHPADIVAALHKAGTSLRRLSMANGYGDDTLKHALRAPYPKAERIIAATIGVTPQAIWPSRYNSDGTTNRPMGRKPFGVKTVRKAKSNSDPSGRNVHLRGAA